jgi:hypothetical protein
MVESLHNKYQIFSQSPIGAAQSTKHVEIVGFLPMMILLFLCALVHVRRWFL